MRVIALDPGVTTGYAIGIIDAGHMYVVTGEERWDHKGLWDFLEENKPDVIISERFEFRNRARKGLELFSRELIGVCNLYCQLNNMELVLQNPLKDNEATFFNDDRLKKDKIHKAGKGHANDAARHLLTWYQFRGGYKYNKSGYESGV